MLRLGRSVSPVQDVRRDPVFVSSASVASLVMARTAKVIARMAMEGSEVVSVVSLPLHSMVMRRKVRLLPALVPQRKKRQKVSKDVLDWDSVGDVDDEDCGWVVVEGCLRLVVNVAIVTAGNVFLLRVLDKCPLLAGATVASSRGCCW